MCNHRGIERTLNAATGLHSALVHQARPAKAPLFVACMKAGVGVGAGHPQGVDFRLPRRPPHWTSLVNSKRHKSGKQQKCYSWTDSSAGAGLAQNLFSKKQTCTNMIKNTAWIWIWITKDEALPTSDNGFIFKKKNINIKEKKKSASRFWGHGQSSQSANFWKIAKIVLFNPCMKFDTFFDQMTS